MSAVEFPSDYSCKSVCSCNPRTQKAALQNETVRTNKRAVFLIMLTVHQMYTLGLLFVSKCKLRETATDLQRCI